MGRLSGVGVAGLHDIAFLSFIDVIVIVGTTKIVKRIFVADSNQRCAILYYEYHFNTLPRFIFYIIQFLVYFRKNKKKNRMGAVTPEDRTRRKRKSG